MARKSVHLQVRDQGVHMTKVYMECLFTNKFYYSATTQTEAKFLRQILKLANQKSRSKNDILHNCIN